MVLNELIKTLKNSLIKLLEIHKKNIRVLSSRQDVTSHFLDVLQGST